MTRPRYEVSFEGLALDGVPARHQLAVQDALATELKARLTALEYRGPAGVHLPAQSIYLNDADAKTPQSIATRVATEVASGVDRSTR